MSGPVTYVDGHSFTERLQRFGQGDWFAIAEHADRIGRLVPAQLGPTSVEDALDAVAAATAIVHPRILSLHGVELVPGHPARLAIVTEQYDDLRSLERVMIPRAPLREMEALHVLRELVEAVGAMAAFPHAHGWLTPARIYLDEDTHLLLTNPWVGWIEDRLDQARTSGTTDWEYTWVAPECIAQPGSADLVSDLFITCAIGYTLITGTSPFDSDTVLELGTELLPTAADPRDSNAAISERLAAIMAKGLDLGRESRYQRAEDLIEDIDAALRRKPPPHATSATTSAGPPAAVPATATESAVQRSSDFGVTRSATRHRSSSGEHRPRRRGTDPIAPAQQRAMVRTARGGSGIPPLAWVVGGGLLVLILGLAGVMALLSSGPTHTAPPVREPDPVVEERPATAPPSRPARAPPTPSSDTKPPIDASSHTEATDERRTTNPASGRAPGHPDADHLRAENDLVRVRSRKREIGLRTIVAGGPVYADRDYHLIDPPAWLLDQTWLLFNNDDKRLGGRVGNIELQRPATVILGIDHRLDQPRWMRPDWVALDDRLRMSDGDSILKLYARSFPAGVVDLGTNPPGTANANHYIVIVTERTLPLGDRTAIGSAPPDAPPESAPPTGTTSQLDNLSLVSAPDQGYELAELTPDLLVYTDRNYRLGDVPTALAGGILLRVPCDAKSLDKGKIELALQNPARVFIAHSITHTRRPRWMDAWQPAGFGLELATGQEFECLVREVPAGPLHLGPNRASDAPDHPGHYLAVVRFEPSGHRSDEPGGVAIDGAEPAASPRELHDARQALLAAQAALPAVAGTKPAELEALIEPLSPRWQAVFQRFAESRTALQSQLIDHPDIPTRKPTIEVSRGQRATILGADAGGVTVALAGGSATGRVGWILLSFEQVVDLYRQVLGRRADDQRYLLALAAIDAIPEGLELEAEAMRVLRTEVDLSIPAQTDAILLLADEAEFVDGDNKDMRWTLDEAPAGAASPRVWRSAGRQLGLGKDDGPHTIREATPHLRYRFYARGGVPYLVRVRAQCVATKDRNVRDAVGMAFDRAVTLGPESGGQERLAQDEHRAALYNGWGHIEGWHWLSARVDGKRQPKGRTVVTFPETGWQWLRIHSLQGPILLDAVFLSTNHRPLPGPDHIPDAPR